MGTGPPFFGGDTGPAGSRAGDRSDPGPRRLAGARGDAQIKKINQRIQGNLMAFLKKIVLCYAFESVL